MLKAASIKAVFSTVGPVIIMDFNTLKKIVCCPAISGRETAIMNVISKLVTPLTDEISIDPLGNLVAVKYGRLHGNGAKKIMLCAHADEIGFIVTNIEANGFIRFGSIGGINYISAAYTQVVFENGMNGVLVPETGVKGSDITYDKCYVDIGAKDKKDAERKVSVGDYFVATPSLTKLMGKRVAGRPLDDRIGCAILVDVAEMLKDVQTDSDVYYTFSVQEEVGCRGAKTAAFNIAPDYALAFDVTGTGDTIGAKPMANSVGGGASIKIKDSSVICDIQVVDALKRIARENNIKSQLEILNYGGTDTSSMQLAGIGCHAGAISIPTRYIHSNIELIDLNDVDACTALTVEFIKSL